MPLALSYLDADAEQFPHLDLVFVPASARLWVVKGGRVTNVVLNVERGKAQIIRA